MLKKYVIFGHGDLVGDIIDIIHLNNGKVKKVVQNMFSTNRIPIQDRLRRLDYSVEIQHIDYFQPTKDESYVVGFTGRKIDPLVKQLGLSFVTLIHPHAYISPTAKLSDGVIINNGALVASHAVIGRHVVVNRGATIGHDTRIEDFCVIQPGANVAGHIVIGSGTMVGMGANIIEDLTIGENSVIGAGAVVTSDAPPNSLMVGVPAINKRR